MTRRQILITGADGYLGSRLARKYIDSTGDRLVLWMRSRDNDEFRSKKEKLTSLIGDAGDRVSFHWNDLVNDDPFGSVDPAAITNIIHSAAVTRFNIDEPTALAVNTEGTRKLLRFANGCSSLEKIGLISTVYASGLISGDVVEAPFDRTAGFANHYERSKWLSEDLLVREFEHLPWRVFRVATVIADSKDGRVSQFNAFHNTLKLFYYGLLSLIPGKEETPVYFVTGEFVADAIFELMNNSLDRTIYNVSHTECESLVLGELIDIAFEAFGREDDFRARRILRPLFSDAESFDLLAEGMNSFGGGIVNQAVSSVAPFAKQLFIHKRILNDRVVAGVEHYSAPEIRQLIRNTCDYLVRTKWGKQSA